MSLFVCRFVSFKSVISVVGGLSDRTRPSLLFRWLWPLHPSSWHSEKKLILVQGIFILQPGARGGLVLYSRARLQCRISCVESAMRLPALWCWMWRSREGWRGKEEKHKQTVLPTAVSCAYSQRAFCCLRLSAKPFGQIEEVKLYFVSSSFTLVFTGAPSQ